MSSQGSSIDSVLDFIAILRVPHSYFKHFYVVSVACSVFWIYQLYNQGTVYQALISFETTKPSLDSKINWTVILLMLIQGLRRLAECLRAERIRSSSSRMWIGHYAIGIAFYLFTSIAVWIETVSKNDTFSDRYSGLKWSNTSNLLRYFGLVLFFSASVLQSQVHDYLARMKTYAVPQHFAFKRLRLVAPHYTAECLIYASLAVVGSSQGQVVNKTILCALVFVFVNLSITAYGTKRWMMQKFKEEEVKDLFIMIPGVW